MFQPLSYDTAGSVTEEDHAAVHLINRLMEAQEQRRTPMEAMDDATLRNAVKNPAEIERAARLFYQHVLLGAAQDLRPYRVAAFFLPVGLAMVALDYADVQGVGFEREGAWADRLAVAVQRLAGAMHPGFSVLANGVVRPGESDAATAGRLEIGLAITTVLKDVYEELAMGTFCHDAFCSHAHGQS